MTKSHLLTISLILTFTTLSCTATPTTKEKEKPKPFTPKQDIAGKWSIKVNPKLPNVLIIGDSISIGYTRLVRQQLKDKANILRPMNKNGKRPFNCGDTNRGLKNLDKWLTDTRWDVIHFNWGLHDLCYRRAGAKPYGNRDKVNGTISVPLKQYKINLEKLVLKLKKSNAKLIFATTTLIPQGEAGRKIGDDIKYNSVARQIMKKHKIQINDLHTLTANFKNKHFTKSADVHFTIKGYKLITTQVTKEINKQLMKK